LTRVDADEAVSVTLEVELRGEAPGTHHGGVIDQQLRDVEIECPANAIPEKLTLSINELEVGDSMTASQLELPKGATLLSDASSVIVACVEQTILADEEEEAALEATGAEPEVIGGRKPGEAEEAES
jgi:large subunit ribosomal protein L25